MQLVHALFSQRFMPHGYCYQWNWDLVWLHVVSDTLIALSYLSIPLTLVYFVRKRKGLPFHWMFICFGVFIVACGATHAMEVWNLWHADYWVSGGIKAITAAASVPTAALLIQLVPKALAIPSAEELAALNRALDEEIQHHRQAEEQLRLSEQNIRLLIDNVRDYAICRLDTEGNVASWNVGAERIKGYRADEILGQHFSRFYPPENGQPSEIDGQLTEAADQGRTEREGWRMRKDGSRFWANVVITALRDDQNELRGFAKITKDITAQKEVEDALRASETKFRSVVATANDAIVIADEQGRITDFNDAAERMFLYSAREVVGEPLTLLMPERLRAAHLEGFNRHLKTGEARIVGKTTELQGQKKGGAEFPMEISLSSWKTLKGNFFTGILKDITERKRLEQEMAQRSTELEAVNRELEAFAYSVSHDLRAPLRGINGFSQALLEDCAHLLDTTGKGYLERICAASGRMGSLIDDLLMLSRLTRAEMQIQHMDVSALAGEVVAELAASDPARRINIQIMAGMTAIADPHLVRALLTNLLGNSWKFTSKRPDGNIEFGQSRLNGDSVFFVRDNGAGFNQEHASRLFAPFQRLHSSSEFPGTGIGLATVLRIVNRHGGRAWAEGAVGKGATVYFTLSLSTG